MPRETEQSSGETPCAVNVSSSLRNSLLTSTAPEQGDEEEKATEGDAAAE